MKVDSSPDSYIGSVAGGPQKTADRAPAGAGSAVAAAAQPQASAGVTVSLSMSTTQALSGSGSTSDVFNAEKVGAIKQAIDNGSFQVNAEAIADKMLSNAAEMLGSGSKAA
jgi:negative regulator of flagellin synthesis FlgM